MLKQRVIVSLIGLPILIVLVWFGEPWFTGVIALWGAVAAFEFYKIAGKNKNPVITVFGIIWTLLFILSPYYDKEYAVPALLTSAIILPLAYLLLRRNKEQAFTGWVWTIAGILYIGWLLSYLIMLRQLQIPGYPVEYGRNGLFLAFFTTFASDTSAFFVGRARGKNHMAPAISPKKTWEGAIAGVVGSVVISLLFMLPTPLQLPLSWVHAVILGILVSLFGQIGDLAESLFKRNMGVKDSSNLIPGHGGFLDRMDSIVFAGVTVYYYLVWVLPHL